MLKCKDLSRKAAADELGEFGFMKRMELRFHLFMCRHCRNYVAQIRSIGQGARNLAHDAEPGPEELAHLEKKICDHLCNDAPGSK